VVTIRDTTENRGAAPSPPTVTRLYLRSTRGVETVVGARHVPVLAPRVRNAGATTVVVPATLAPGRYTVVARADDDASVAEPFETNNARTRTITLR
jgi:subtilase family serine protease